MEVDTERQGRRTREEWVVVPAVLGLITFYYFTRADAIGVSSTDRSWTAMTGPPVPAWIHFVSAALLLGALPLLATWLATRRSPRALGIAPGRWREGLLWVAVGVPLAILAGRIAASDATMRAVYPLYPGGLEQPARFWGYAGLQLLYYGAWEVLFRGVLLFGLLDAVGARAANLIQTGLSVTAHFGRALPETLMALPAGLAFGVVALRTRSVWYVALIHWTVGVSMDWFITRGVGS